MLLLLLNTGTLGCIKQSRLQKALFALLPNKLNRKYCTEKKVQKGWYSIASLHNYSNDGLDFRENLE